MLVFFGEIKNKTYYGRYPKGLTADQVVTLAEYLGIGAITEKTSMSILSYRDFIKTMHLEQAIRTIGIEYLIDPLTDGIEV